MYKRLTRRMSDGTAVFAEKSKSFYSAQIYEEAREKNRQILNRLCEIEDKIDQGEIVELPCKIGDEKFVILPNTNVIVKGKICTIIYQNGFLIDFGYNPDRYGGYSKYTQLLTEELFDTKEEANKKLKELENEQRKAD